MCIKTSKPKPTGNNVDSNNMSDNDLNKTTSKSTTGNHKQYDKDKLEEQSKWIGAGVAMAFIVIVVVVILGALYLRRKRRMRRMRKSVRPNRRNDGVNQYTHSRGAAGLKDFCTTIAGEYEIPTSHTNIEDINGNREKSMIGAGEFTVLYKGLLQPGGRTVAIKTIKNSQGSNNVWAMRNALEECQIFMHLGKHPAIVELLGVCTKNVTMGELYIVMEWCERGSLKGFMYRYKNQFVSMVNDGEWVDTEDSTIGTELQSNRISESGQVKFNTLDLFKWCSEVADAMEFLAQRKIVHVSLSARNVLLNEHFTCKISDFRLAKMPDDWPDSNATFIMKRKRGSAPWRWYAVESLIDDVFTNQSDIWTFGIFMWEIFSLGAIPYPEYTYGSEFILCLKHGYRLQIPNYATVESFQLMLTTWYDDPDMRPNFSKLKVKLRSMIPRKLQTINIAMCALNCMTEITKV